jgi:hypothetical protein
MADAAHDSQTRKAATAHEQTAAALYTAHAKLKYQVQAGLVAVTTALVTNPLLVPWRGAIMQASERARTGLETFEEQLTRLLVPVMLPARLWNVADGWTNVRSEVSSVAGDLQVTNREVHVRWKGAARDAYDTVIPAHVAAANRLATVADSMQFAVGWAGFAAAVFYAGLLAIVVELIAGALVALAAAASVVAAVSGLVLLLMVVGAALAHVAALIVLMVEATGRIRLWLTEVRGELRDNSAFPNGMWPQSRTEWFSDGTVTDGDADWSVVR